MSDTNVHRVVGNLLVGTSHFFVDTTTNRVGVNTSSPSASLDIATGDLKVGSGITIGNSGTITATAFDGDGSLLQNINSDSGSWVNGTNSNVHLAVSTDKVGIGTVDPATYLHLSANNSDPGVTEGDFVGTHNLTEYLRFTSVGDPGDVNAVSVGFKLGDDGSIGANPMGRLDICANHGSTVANASGTIPDKTIATFLGSGNVGIGTSSPDEKLHVNGNIRLGGPQGTDEDASYYIKSAGQIHINSAADGTADDSYICLDLTAGQSGSNRSGIGICGAATSTTYQHIVFETTDTERMRINYDGNVGIGTTTPHGALDVRGAVTITPSSTADSYATKNGYMAAGSLNIGSIGANFGGGTAGWNSNTAGLMLECADNTEIAVHDSGTRVASLMYYQGGSNTITMGRDMGWGRTKINHAFTEKFNFHWNPNQWGYATNAYATELNLWAFGLYVPYDGWIFIKCHAHWARLNSANNAHAGGNDSFYAWLSVASRSPDLSANYDTHSGASNSSYDKFHSYQSPDASGAGSWRDFNHSGFYKVSAGNNTVSLRVVNYFTGGHHLNINGGAVSGFYMPKNYV